MKISHDYQTILQKNIQVLKKWRLKIDLGKLLVFTQDLNVIQE